MYIKFHSVLFVFFVIKLTLIFVVHVLSGVWQPLSWVSQLRSSTKNHSGIRKKGEELGN